MCIRDSILRLTTKADQIAMLKRCEGLSVEKARKVITAFKEGKQAPVADAEGDEGSDEGSEGSDEGSDDAPTGLTAAKVLRATIPFAVVYGDVVQALRGAVENGDLKTVETLANALARSLAKQEGQLRKLVGDDAYQNAALDFAKRAAK